MGGARHVLSSAVWAVVCAVAAAEPAESMTATIRLRPRKELGGVQHLVFGHNVEAADTRGIFSPTSNPIMGQTGDGVWDPAAVANIQSKVQRLGLSQSDRDLYQAKANFQDTVGPVLDSAFELSRNSGPIRNAGRLTHPGRDHAQ